MCTPFLKPINPWFREKLLGTHARPQTSTEYSKAYNSPDNQTEWMRGFQRGNPTRDKTVTICAFDAHDREIELLILIGRAPGASRNVTQQERTRIIYSLRPNLASQTE